MIIFDGKAFAAQKELELQKQVDALHAAGKTVIVKTITFREDEGSRLYTALKKKAADRIGILYEPLEYSLSDPTSDLVDQIRSLSYLPSITGIMVQKPAKTVWTSQTSGHGDEFEHWWETLTSVIDPQKDVDCLTQQNLNTVYRVRSTDFQGVLLPATVRACISILQQAKHDLALTDEDWRAKSVLVIGKSDIVGKPLTHVLRSMGHTVVNVGSTEFANTKVSDFPIVISAAGKENLITGTMVQEGAVLIDVGSPSPDIERFSVEPKAAFLTPVPGGVGPVTVASLMENIVRITNI